MYILAKFNTFSKSWKLISKFNTFSILSIPRGNPEKGDIVEAANFNKTITFSLKEIFTDWFNWVIFVETNYLNTYMCNSQSLLSHESRVHSEDFSKVCCQTWGIIFFGPYGALKIRDRLIYQPTDIGRYLGFTDILVSAKTADFIGLSRYWQNAVILLTHPDNLRKKA